MADILQPTDQFLVNRSDSTKTVTTEDLMAELQDTDLMLVNRGGTTYTITGEDVKDSLNPGPGPISFTPTITGDNKVGDVLTANAGAITGGVAPVEYAFQWKRDGDDISSATAKTYTLVNADVGETISCDVTCAEPDGSGAVTETAVYGLTPINPERAPVIGSVNLVENNPGNAPRFTDQAFVTTVLMTDQGVPQSTKEFQAKVEGTITTTSNFERVPTTVDIHGAAGTATLVSGGPIYSGNIDPTWFGTTAVSYDSQWFSYEPNYYQGGSIGWTYETTGIINNNGSNIIYLLYAIELASTTAGGDSWSAEIYFTDGTSTTTIGGTTNRSPNGAVQAAELNLNPALDPTKTINKVRFQWNQLAAQMNLRIRFYGFNFTGSTNEKITAAETDYTSVVFDSSDQFNLLEVGDVVTQSGAAFNPIQSIDEAANTFIIPGPNQNVSTSVPIIGPDKTVVIENATKYLDFNTAGTVTSLLDAPMDPPVSLPDENPQLTLTFPSTFPSGETPDQELGNGTTLTVDVKAVSNGFEDEESSNTVQPSVGGSLPPGALSGLVTTYAGVDSNRIIINGINSSTTPTMWWIKAISGTDAGGVWWVSTDTVNQFAAGSVSNLWLNSDDAQSTGGGLLTGILYDNGFGAAVSDNTNKDGKNYVAYSFTQSPGYFDIVKYSGSGANNTQSVPHNLNSTPGMMIVKDIGVVGNNGEWWVYHKDLTDPANSFMWLNKDQLRLTTYGPWGGTLPTDTNFTVEAETNYLNSDYMAYLFADTPGLIKCGSYTGNGGNQQVDCGFEPQWLLLKMATESGNPRAYDKNWFLIDSKRPSQILSPNISDEQYGFSDPAAFNSNGFSFIGAPDGILNLSGCEYVFVAIAAPVVRSLTEAEFAQQRLNFETYKNRKEVKCGEDALAARQALIDKLREQGYTDAEIDAELGIT